MPRARSHRMTGLSLIELMISLVIGSVLIAGAVLVYSQSRSTYSVNETVARLQEQARYVFSIMEPDVQLAGYYGYSNAPQDFSYWAAGSITPVSQLQQLAADKDFDSVLPTGVTNCGKNFAVDLLATVEGSTVPADGTTALDGAGCRSPDTAPLKDSDTLTIRRSSVDDAAPTSARLQLLVNRLKRSNERIFNASTAPETVDPKVNAVRDLMVRTYYVSQVPNKLPELRVIALGDGPKFDDTAVMSGIQDMQVQFGLDTGDYDGDGVIDPAQDLNNDGIPDSPNGIATRYVDPQAASAAAFAGLQVVSVRIWLLIRADRPEPGYTNTTTYKYAGFTYAPADNIRRILVSRTIQLRNARTL
jgi:type IV pilus assembly protein PilW